MGSGKSIKFQREEMELIRLFDTITGAATLDCVILPDGEENERVIFVVNRQDLRKAVGIKGDTELGGTGRLTGRHGKGGAGAPAAPRARSPPNPGGKTPGSRPASPSAWPARNTCRSRQTRSAEGTRP